MIENGLKHTTTNPCVYIKWFGMIFALLLLYVDDILILGKDTTVIIKLKKELSHEFALNDPGLAKQIFGMQIARDSIAKKIWLS